jgi:hypothetical protein
MLKVWRVIFATGLATLVCGLLIAFVNGDYYRYHISYAQMLFLDKLIWPVLLAAVLLSIIGSVGILIRLSNKAAILLGVGSTLVSVITPIGLQSLFYVSVFNVHSWIIVFIAPVFTGVVIGMIFTLVGSFRAVSDVYRKKSQPRVE